MELIDVKVDTHGGSIRCIVKNMADSPEINDSVKTLLILRNPYFLTKVILLILQNK